MKSVIMKSERIRENDLERVAGGLNVYDSWGLNQEVVEEKIDDSPLPNVSVTAPKFMCLLVV